MLSLLFLMQSMLKINLNLLTCLTFKCLLTQLLSRSSLYQLLPPPWGMLFYQETSYNILISKTRYHIPMIPSVTDFLSKVSDFLRDLQKWHLSTLFIMKSISCTCLEDITVGQHLPKCVPWHSCC